MLLNFQVIFQKQRAESKSSLLLCLFMYWIITESRQLLYVTKPWLMPPCLLKWTSQGREVEASIAFFFLKRKLLSSSSPLGGLVESYFGPIRPGLHPVWCARSLGDCYCYMSIHGQFHVDLNTSSKRWGLPKRKKTKPNQTIKGKCKHEC